MTAFLHQFIKRKNTKKSIAPVLAIEKLHKLLMAVPGLMETVRWLYFGRVSLVDLFHF